MSPALLEISSAPVEVEVKVRDLKLEARNSAPTRYYNARLNPMNYMEGPLSTNPATRLRQMLARPGIVVGHSDGYTSEPCLTDLLVDRAWNLRRHQCTMRRRSRLQMPLPKVHLCFILTVFKFIPIKQWRRDNGLG